MRLVQFGAVDIPQFNAQHQFPVSFRSSVIPLRGGGFDQDGANSYLEPKVLSASFWVSEVDVASIDDLINSLYSEADKGRRILVARLRDDSLWQAEAKLVSAATSADSRTYAPDTLDVQGYDRMQLSFEVPYPYWLVAEDVGKFLDEGWYMNSGITLDSGQQTEVVTALTVNTFTIDNNGGVKHEHSELTITALAGATITDVLVENLTTGEELLWEGTLAPTEVLEIKTLPQTIRFEGADAYADVTLPNAQIGFWRLALGENEFRITFTSVSGGNAQINYAWARHYIR
jgi:hypothetical protein